MRNLLEEKERKIRAQDTSQPGSEDGTRHHDRGVQKLPLSFVTSTFVIFPLMLFPTK